MKRILLALMLGIGALGFAQDSEEKTKEIIKEQIVDKNKKLQAHRFSSILQKRQ